MESQGALDIVGCGLHPGQMTLETVGIIQAADRVLVVAPNPLSNQHIQSLNPNLENLGRLYNEQMTRLEIYQAMVERMVELVREGLRVCMVFYGHPGVFVLSTQLVRERLEQEGYPVRMLPGISADACLFADLGLDPSTTGCQAFEASQFLMSRRQIDTGAALILWQIGLVGEMTGRAYTPGKHGLAAITRLLLQHYPAEHRICLYEAPTLPGFAARKDWLALRDLPQAKLESWTTMLVPAATDLVLAEERLGWLEAPQEATSHG